MNIKCQVIMDLMPLYLDELTSQESNELIQDHIADCQVCRQYLIQMKKGVIKEEVQEEPTEPSRDINKKIILRIKKHIIKVNILFSIFGALFSFYAIGKVDYSLIFWVFTLAGMIGYWVLESFLMPAAFMFFFAFIGGVFALNQIGEEMALLMLIMGPVFTITGSSIAFNIKKVFE